MGVLDHQLEAPEAPGEPLVVQVVADGKVLRFLFNVEPMPKGLWRGSLLEALQEEVAIMEAKLRAPVMLKALPPGMPSPTAIVGAVTADDPATAVLEWNHAMLRAMRNLSMAYGVPMPRVISTREAVRATG